jgi:hypothetical protein
VGVGLDQLLLEITPGRFQVLPLGLPVFELLRSTGNIIKNSIMAVCKGLRKAFRSDANLKGKASAAAEACRNVLA